MASDAIVVGEEWISEHYFATDATKESFKARVLERRKQWDAEKESGTVRTRWTGQRSSLVERFARLAAGAETPRADLAELHRDLRRILGYDALGQASHRRGPVTFVNAPGLENSPGIALVEAVPGETWEELFAKDAATLIEPYPLEEDAEAGSAAAAKTLTSVSRLLSHLFVASDERPAFVLVLAGRFALVAERERWPEGRYLLVDLQLVAERAEDGRGGETDRALTCVEAASLVPDAQGDIWWSATLDESVKHTVGVSKDLREGVRLSIEIIANEVVSRRVAQGLEPLPAAEAQELAKQSLRYLYRILFLLYAEASPELGVLPVGAPEYEQGYSLDRLRELVQVDLLTPRTQNGTHFYDSLEVLFAKVSGRPTRPDAPAEESEVVPFRSLEADLFAEQATAHINAVKLGNAALQEVLQHLLLSKKSGSKDRGFISYAELGINQLGAVYEGLMSYTGFFATDDLYEVAKDGNPEKGSWVVPTHRVEGIAAKDFVKTRTDLGEEVPVVHPKGSFVYRLAGRERQQSASYYTPEVLTRFTVSQALEELLDQDGHTTTAEEILNLTVCEPALGSGAFAIEAVRQLADEYLKRRQAELGQEIDPDAYARELQKVKAYLALHQTYGVDLNATAVELAEISLWLDTMVEGLQAPWFGLHLRRGNSLIGARNAVYPRYVVEKKQWASTVPTPVKPHAAGDAGGDTDETVAEIDGRIPHFLLPAAGWGSAAEVGKEIKDLVPDRVAALKKWRKSMIAKPGKKEVDALVDLGRRVERLWEIATQRLRIAEAQVRRDLDLWGEPETVAALRHVDGRVVSRQEIEASLADPDGAYQRLKLVMDAWCALWFWPLTETEVAPPTLEQWNGALRQVLGITQAMTKAKNSDDDSFALSLDWDSLGELEDLDRAFAGAEKIEKVLAEHPWLAVTQKIAEQQGFFHWELQFASVFADRGGFDLQVGNPPWVRPRTDVEALLAEGDPWWQLANKATQADKASRRALTMQVPGIHELVVGASSDVIVTAEWLGAVTEYPVLAGLQPDLYRCFMVRTWLSSPASGVVSLIHPESHFTDEKAAAFRGQTYARLRRHWQFINELTLFEIHHLVVFGVHVYSSRKDPEFLNAASLYHPETVERSLRHDGSGIEPGIKDAEGSWDTSPHRGRIQTVDADMLATWHALLEAEETPIAYSRMVYTVNSASAQVLGVLSGAPRLGSLPLEFSRGWDESIDRKKGRFEVAWGEPVAWDEVILQGPHFHVGVPFYKQPNASMKNNLDWSPVDLETLKASAVPVTSYKPAGSRATYDTSYTHWGEHGEIAARDHYRVAWRMMAANTGERTLIPAILPPGAAHIHGIFSAGGVEPPLLVDVASSAMSLLTDFVVRAVPKATIASSTFSRMPRTPAVLRHQRAVRVLRLNCLTDAYSDLYDSVIEELGGPLAVGSDTWTGGLDYPGRSDLGDVPATWNADVPLRRGVDRRQALVEIDALVALGLGVSADDLCTIYRTQFPVLAGYDRNKYFYDANGREVPTPVLQVFKKKGLSQTDTSGMTEEERTHTNASGNTYVYELPFVTLDREADMRAAYAHFEALLDAERQG